MFDVIPYYFDIIEELLLNNLILLMSE